MGGQSKTQEMAMEAVGSKTIDKQVKVEATSTSEINLKKMNDYNKCQKQKLPKKDMDEA